MSWEWRDTIIVIIAVIAFVAFIASFGAAEDSSDFISDVLSVSDYLNSTCVFGVCSINFNEDMLLKTINTTASIANGSLTVEGNLVVTGNVTLSGFHSCNLETNSTGGVVCGVDDTGSGSLTLAYVNYVGSDLSGSSGDYNRTVPVDSIIVNVDNFYLHHEFDYNTTGGTTQFFNRIWDDQQITIWFYSGSNETWVLGHINITSIHGLNLTGNDGETGRSIIVGNLSQVAVDNFFLHPTVDYNYGTDYNLSFVNRVWDDQKITLWRFLE